MSLDVCLLLYGLVAAVAAPRLLQRCATQRAPRLGVAAWLLAAVSVLASWLLAALSLVDHEGTISQVIGVAGVAALAGRLAWVSARTWLATRSRQTQHRRAARLLGRHDPTLGALIVDFPDPLAYCVPHCGGGLVVVTSGARSVLSPRQLHAVLAHEREHLAGRHHLILTTVRCLSLVVPRLRLFQALVPEIGRLLEMRADDVAARVHGRHTVATAIAAMGGPAAPATPAGALGAGGATAILRATRLMEQSDGRGVDRLRLSATGALLAIGPFLATVLPCPHPW